MYTIEDELNISAGKHVLALGGCCPLRPNNTLLDLLNSSHPTQPDSLFAK